MAHEHGGAGHTGKEVEAGQNINFEDVAGAVSGILSDYEAYFNHCLKIVEFGTKALIPFH